MVVNGGHIEQYVD